LKLEAFAAEEYCLNVDQTNVGLWLVRPDRHLDQT
jgi:hypothetical protein